MEMYIYMYIYIYIYIYIYLTSREALSVLFFCCKARRKRLEHERSVGRNTRLRLVLLPMVWLYFSSFRFCSVLFLNTELYIVRECKLCLIFITIRKFAI